MSHDLELRPKHHYQTSVKHSGDSREEEPPPVEGFLIRLTTQRGTEQRMKKMFFERLYFFTQSHYLFFCKPVKAVLPHPPNLRVTDSNAVPSSQEILDRMPLQYDINPFPVENGQIT